MELKKRIKKVIKKVARKTEVDEMLCDKCRQPLGSGFITVSTGRRFCSPACQGIER